MSKKLTIKTEYKPIESLIPYAKNARTHSAEQILKLRKSIRRFGFINPVLLDEKGEIIAGHGRTLAAAKEKMKELPCIVLSHLSAAQKRMYRLADNRLAEDAGWDEELVRQEMIELDQAGEDLRGTGFDDAEIEKFTADQDEEMGQMDLDDDPEHLIVIECDDEDEQRKLFEELQERGLKCKIM